MNIGLIGCGQHAVTRLIPALGSFGRGVSLYLCDSLKERRDYLSHRYKYRITGDYRDIITDRSIKAVIVATPPDDHYTLAKAALENGKHVLVEKPVTDNRTELKELKNIRDRMGLSVMVSHQRRFGQPENEIKKCVAKEGRGDIVCYNFTHNFSDATRKAVSGYLGRGDRPLGVLMEYFCHDADFIRYAFSSDFRSVYATARGVSGPLDAVALQAELENGVLVNGFLSSAVSDSEKIEVFTKHTYIYFDRYRTPAPEIYPVGLLRNRPVRFFANIKSGIGSVMMAKFALKRYFLYAYIKLISEFMKCVEHGTPASPGLEDWEETLKTIEAAHSSILSGKRQWVDR